MALRDWSQVRYLPLLSVRPAEMRALEELPNKTKDRLLPVIELRPWVASNHLENSFERVRVAYGERPVVVAMSEPEIGSDRPVFGELERMRSAESGFKAWCDLFKDRLNLIPTIQFSPSVKDENRQIEVLYGLNRGLLLAVNPQMLQGAAPLYRRAAERTEGGADVCVMMDLGYVNASTPASLQAIRQHAQLALEALPNCTLVISGSSFPDSFVNLGEQPIYERLVFQEIGLARTVYGDRGSARVERQVGGGGLPAPRIDYSTPTRWHFFRSSDTPGFDGYERQAQNVIASALWKPNLRVWGTQMIERTAAGDQSAISNAQRATAARINLHLHVQTFYDNPDDAEQTEEEWTG